MYFNEIFFKSGWQKKNFGEKDRYILRFVAELGSFSHMFVNLLKKNLNSNFDINRLFIE